MIPEPGAEHAAYATKATPPEGPCQCGSVATPLAVKPVRESPDWWDDPSAFWRCPDCGQHRGDVDEPLYEDDSA